MTLKMVQVFLEQVLSPTGFDDNGVATELRVGDFVTITGNDSDDVITFEVISDTRIALRNGDGAGEEASYTYSYSDGIGLFEFTNEDLVAHSEIESVVNTALADGASALSVAVLGGNVYEVLSALVDLDVAEFDTDAHDNLYIFEVLRISMLSGTESIGSLVGPLVSIDSSSITISDTETTGYSGSIGFSVER